MTPKVTFTETTAASVTKPSYPARKRSKIPSQKGLWPACNPELQQMLNANRVASFQQEIDMQIACWCDDLAEAGIWPNAFGVLVYDRSQPTSLQVLGLSDNTHPENRKLPTDEQIR
ncbi:hypothetical protein BT96DRAFT_1000719 [Gymnopus androsaceus JB14]|uniref:Uncharacterized protein n=1 Tax=Gymnopus androsaceus JB14 TaxID=1447944 RepID=A0A6A4H4H1_9AGAR|nr:hypothetical protein BT96DRAFT_1000719 [Gymnopus androsaceus JB14]